MFSKFRLIKINNNEFIFIYNDVEDENYGEFIVNVDTNEVEVIKFAKLDDGGGNLSWLLKKSQFLNKLKDYKETRQLDDKTYRINCG